MPQSADFARRLAESLEQIVDHYGTPFHLYDEQGIRDNGEALLRAFAGVDHFKEYFAVKALPNPTIMKIMQDLGFGFDCSSTSELALSREIGARGEEIMFTSNNTSAAEFAVAEADGGCVLNLDDISLVEKVPQMPELICFRYNPGERRSGNSIIGNPVESKYGVAHDQLLDAYKLAMQRGARRFGLHTMLASNELNHAYMVETARMLLDRIRWLSEALAIEFEFINIGGGLGIPYRPQEKPLDIVSMGHEIAELLSSFKAHQGYAPKLFLESGRYITGPYGVLVTRAINRKEIYRTYVGVDACMSSLMRPGMYGSYHHVTVHGKQGEEETVDVVGSLCENNDKFAIQRPLPSIEDGDIVVIHDTGAHGHAMGFNYNGKARPKELLLRSDGSVELIRREENIDDLFATLNYEPDRLLP
ncbi:MAG: diaminopimelate decarboxylase [gamma proteobacterium symbiont of Ctena orbiculata]|uniref:Diaminopimelate decarboxylase n=1 Tax=Candidatus Thiodiazotropha taylori TaxID=2792791 RepID=A0A944MDF3_9GAMM|nr:diaminopimelate decarboxylase [Candidatus Thiodiazotropha taylori]PUB90621.1 MAG: diaminopimelate decarboxylase [gamma proteobacterium symbiont of Ctena orbiculata]MBT3027037.1 diaminopimelate decarboxylase [Candidatus Thiodiazotropha taylori]MBT3034671.1 diaminopimelate decarboxylase [Candidatus Thiodiazotropha taylori]MBV2137414.1 diaminopimelate decarboxylase [Candidatus Thiodiazotropha taylori]